MKKVLALAFVGLVAFSCSKKDENSIQDSNIMLEEPKAEIVGEATTAAADASAESATAQDTTDAPAAPADSTATK